jgi:hypothetical protein
MAGKIFTTILVRVVIDEQRAKLRVSKKDKRDENMEVQKLLLLHKIM